MAIDISGLDEKELEKLLLEEADSILGDYKVELPDDSEEIIFMDEYLELIKEGFMSAYDYVAEYDDMVEETSIIDEMFIFQPVIGKGDHHYIAGFAAEAAILQQAAEYLYKRSKESLKMPDFAGTKEDAIDLFSEFLNNVNGFCTFKFNLGFDLKLPEFKERVELSAPQIHVVPVKIQSSTLYLFLIYGSSYDFEEVVF